jgi:hypothetical protein
VGLLPALCGCVRRHASAAPEPAAYGPVTSHATDSSRKTIVTPEEGLSGKVAWENSNLRFVVLTFPVGQMPKTGQHLSVFRQGLKVGEVKITGPQQDDSIVADVIVGEAHPGDVARER